MTLLARTLLVFLVASAVHIPQSNAEGVPHGLLELCLTGWSKPSSEGLGCSLPEAAWQAACPYAICEVSEHLMNATVGSAFAQL